MWIMVDAHFHTEKKEENSSQPGGQQKWTSLYTTHFHFEIQKKKMHKTAFGRKL